MTFWALNAWDLSSPAKILIIAGSISVIGVAVLLALVRSGLRPLPSGLAIGGIIALLMYWHTVGVAIGMVLASLMVLLWWRGRRATTSKLAQGLAIAVVAAAGVGPLVQVALAHIEDAVPYPLVDLPSPPAAQPSGSVEDVLVVVVDTYPNLMLRKTWFGEDSSGLVAILKQQEFAVLPSAWARHTYTALSVPSILELQSVVEPGPTGIWGNRSSAFAILRGDNLVARTLQGAGFRYTHIESGWDGSNCGTTVDRCIRAPWVDEPVWQLLKPSIASGWLEERLHTITGTFNTAASLKRELKALTANGSHDYIFAHLLLPHDPYVVDERCQPLQHADVVDQSVTSRAAFSAQMVCVDRMLTESLAAVGKGTAVLLTGDHGSNTGLQVARPPHTWTDLDIAERLGVFVAYKIPQSCSEPHLADPIVAMNAILTCTVDLDFFSSPPQYMIGAENPELVEPDRMARIQAQVAAGLLPSSDG